jgi:16S rRNA (adenine1518-N6/adenine1519-N6)-dimethyltransferase
LARRIVGLAEVPPGGHVLEVGAGLGSLTTVLASTGAEVVAVEVDPRLVPALREVTDPNDNVRVVVADAASADWNELLPGPGPWTVVANLPYNVAVPVVMRLLQDEPRVDRMLVMVQREVGERLAAGPGDLPFGAVSLRVAYQADARVVRNVARSVFWPRPNVDSVLVALIRRPSPVPAEEGPLFRVIEEAFSQRRKTMRGALVRLGLDRAAAERTLAGCGVDPSARPEQLGLSEFACLAEAWTRAGGTVR